MAESNTRQDLEQLSASIHTAESFGRAITAAALTAAAGKAKTFQLGRPITIKVDVTVTPLMKGTAWVCVGVPGFGRICRIERDDTP